jgi:hypothetical protein
MRKLRVFQFSLLSLLSALAIISVWLGWYVGKIRQKQSAVAIIEECGGIVVYDYQWSESMAWKPNAVPPGPKWMRWLLGDNYAAEPVEVQLYKDRGMSPERFTDAEARCIGSLRELEWLVLSDTRITDAGLRQFKTLKKLRRLDVDDTLVTDDGVEELQRALPELMVFH